MKNLTPHRKFRGVETFRPSVRPFYRQPWPKDIPDACGICGSKFLFGFNLTIGPNKLGRILRKITYVIFLPCALGGFAAPIFMHHILRDIMNGDVITIMMFSIYLLPLVLLFASLMMPITRHVECKKCGWEHDFQLPKSPVNSLQRDSAANPD